MAGALSRNLVQFSRILRLAGLPVGPAETIVALHALSHIDLGERAAFQATLRAVMVHRHDQQDLFDQAFALFWQRPAAAAPGDERASGGTIDDGLATPGSRRLREAMSALPRDSVGDEPELSPDSAMTFSALEVSRTMDFAAMSAAEIAGAKAAIKTLRLPLDARRTRRWRPDRHGERIDLGATTRRSLATGGEIAAIARRRRLVAPPPLVVLCDISGSMSRYAEIMLHFLHGVANDRQRVEVFLFGTRLSKVTRQMKHRDPEQCFAMISSLIPDWSGGTRIGEALAAFNRLWSRRVLGQGAVVLLVTDGLDRDGANGLAESMARLHRSCRRLIWLNPLLRWDGFTPVNQGARAMLPYVDEFRPVHNLNSLKDLIATLSKPPAMREAAAMMNRNGHERR